MCRVSLKKRLFHTCFTAQRAHPVVRAFRFPHQIFAKALADNCGCRRQAAESPNHKVSTLRSTKKRNCNLLRSRPAASKCFSSVTGLKLEIGLVDA